MSIDPHAKLRDLMHVASNSIEKVFKTSGRVLPMWHAVDADGRTFIVPVPPDMQKDFAVWAMRRMLEERRVAMVIFIDEAWMVDARQGDAEMMAEVASAIQRGNVSESPKRIEAVILLGEDEHGTVVGIRRIIRPYKGVAGLAPLDISVPEYSAGRLAGMMPQKGPRQ